MFDPADRTQAVLSPRCQLYPLSSTPSGESPRTRWIPSTADSFRTLDHVNDATRTVLHLHLQAMPAGTVLLFRDEGNNLSVQVTGFGFTPGSSHTVELVRGRDVLTAAGPHYARRVTGAAPATGC